MKHLIIGIGLFFAGTAYADDTVHPYLQAQFHSTNSDLTSDDIYPGTNFSVDDTDTGFAVRGGVFKEHRAFGEMMGFYGAELGYVDLGENTASGGGFSASAEIDGFDLALIAGTEAVFSDLYAYARLGLYSWDGSDSASFNGVSASADESGADITFGIGVMYFIDQLQIRAGFDRYMIEYNSDTDIDVDVASLGLQFHF